MLLVLVLVVLVVVSRTEALQVKDDVKFDLTKLAAGEMFCVNCSLALAPLALGFCQGFQESFVGGKFQHRNG